MKLFVLETECTNIGNVANVLAIKPLTQFSLRQFDHLSDSQTIKFGWCQQYLLTTFI
jgi:nitrogen regulatory protein PII-like uncharacterized protein